MSGLDRELKRLRELSRPSAVLTAGQNLWRPFARLSRRQRSGQYRGVALEAAAKLATAAGFAGFGIEGRRTERELLLLAAEFRQHSEDLR